MLHVKFSTRWVCVLFGSTASTHIQWIWDKILNSVSNLAFFLFLDTSALGGILEPRLVSKIRVHSKWTQAVWHYQVIPESRQSMEYSWNVGKRSGRKAMLSLMGGAAMTSSRLACSLDSWSGNSRQDETHPDTLAAPTLPKFCPEYSFILRVFVFLSTLVVKISESWKERRSVGYLGHSRNSCTMFVVQKWSQEIKPRRNS